MYIGLKNGNIVAFSKTRDELEMNAKIKQIELDSIEETDEEIIPYYNTPNDGIYFKKSQALATPAAIANAVIRQRREELYCKLSDPLTNEIAVLRDEIEHEVYSGESGNDAQAKLTDLFLQRQAVRQQIVFDLPYVKEEI